MKGVLCEFLFLYSERNVPFQEQINLEVGGNDDGQGKDVELKVVHGVVDIRPVSWAATEHFQGITTYKSWALPKLPLIFLIAKILGCFEAKKRTSAQPSVAVEWR